MLEFAFVMGVLVFLLGNTIWPVMKLFGREMWKDIVGAIGYSQLQPAPAFVERRTHELSSNCPYRRRSTDNKDGVYGFRSQD